MAAVSPEDDSRRRFVLHHFRFDPERRERRNVVVGAWDDEAEYTREEHRVREVVTRRRSAEGGDPLESLSGRPFLVEVDVRSRVVTARLGLSWGYYLRGGQPSPQQVQPVTGHRWRIQANQLRRDYPGWTFG
jgi:hypothetical protein